MARLCTRKGTDESGISTGTSIAKVERPTASNDTSFAHAKQQASPEPPKLEPTVETGNLNPSYQSSNGALSLWGQ
jgi:hypothetical protein